MEYDIQPGDKLFAVKAYSYDDFNVTEWIVEEAYAVAGIQLYKCRKCGEVDEYVHFWENLVMIVGGDDMEYIAFAHDEKDMLYNYMVNRAEVVAKCDLEKKIEILKQKLNDLNHNIDEAKKMRDTIEKSKREGNNK